MTIEYDPELPYVLFDAENDQVLSRFDEIEDAKNWFEYNGYDENLVLIIDTTPKPKIPEDAEFIYYNSWANSTHYAKRVGHPANRVWETSNPTSQVSEDDLLSRIGDAEVTVLVRKKES